MGPPSDAPKIVGPRLLHHKAITTYPLVLYLLKRYSPSGFQKLLFENDGVIIPFDIEGVLEHISRRERFLSVN